MQLGRELGVAVKVVRPGALVDYAKFEPPGRLGRRLGNVFVAAGWPRDTIGVVEVAFAASALLWIAEHFDESPDVLNLLSPTLPSRRDLLSLLRRGNPDLRVVWLPTPLVKGLAVAAIVVQHALRPRKPAMNVARAFAAQRLDTTLIQTLAPKIQADFGG
jgi:hypothetical protein